MQNKTNKKGAIKTKKKPSNFAHKHVCFKKNCKI